MPVSVTYPGVYIQELPSTSHTITPAPTNIAVFIGYPHPLKTLPGNFGKPVQIFGFTDYQRQFGGFLRSTAYARAGSAQWVDGSTTVTATDAARFTSFADMASQVNQFFLTGGTEAYVVGLLPSAIAGITGAQWRISDVNGVTFTAREITDEIMGMTVTIRSVSGSPPTETADVTITYGPAATPQGPQPPVGTVTETYRQVNLTPGDPNYIETRIGTAQNPVSNLVTVGVGSSPYFVSANQQPFPIALPGSTALFEASDFTAVMQQNTPLDKLSIFNLMVIPGVTNDTVLSAAEAFCLSKRAFLIIDPPIADSSDGMTPNFPNTILVSMNNNEIPTDKSAALYFPYLKSPDPLTGQPNNPVTGTQNEIPPSGTVAGIFAATDLSRGVWKAPAGFQATTTNTTGVVDRGQMTDQQQGVLNPLGVNCLRDFPNIGTVVFGARTLVTLTDEQWRYVPVRRMALFLEQSLYANLGWVVFEPNADPLWTAIDMSISSFMLGLFRQGAFAGTTPSQAFFVQCDSQTTTQDDVNNGIVNVVVGFAPLKPAEFVIITITQIAGQTQTS